MESEVRGLVPEGDRGRITWKCRFNSAEATLVPLLHYFGVYTKAEQGSCTSLCAAASPESTEANSREHSVPITKKRKVCRKANSVDLAESRVPGRRMRWEAKTSYGTWKGFALALSFLLHWSTGSAQRCYQVCVVRQEHLARCKYVCWKSGL